MIQKETNVVFDDFLKRLMFQNATRHERIVVIKDCHLLATVKRDGRPVGQFIANRG